MHKQVHPLLVASGIQHHLQPPHSPTRVITAGARAQPSAYTACTTDVHCITHRVPDLQQPLVPFACMPVQHCRQLHARLRIQVAAKMHLADNTGRRINPSTAPPCLLHATSTLSAHRLDR